MYKTSEDVLVSLRSGKTSLPSVTRQMHRYYVKKDIEKWVMFARAKTLYQMESEDGLQRTEQIK